MPEFSYYGYEVFLVQDLSDKLNWRVYLLSDPDVDVARAVSQIHAEIAARAFDAMLAPKQASSSGTIAIVSDDSVTRLAIEKFFPESKGHL